MENYEYIKSIGQGMYGQVFLARNKIENKNYAIKRINFQDIAEKDKNNIENEVKLLKQLRHPNIVSYKDSFLDKDNYYNIVMIYCDGGDIYSKIKAQKKEYFPEEDILNWIVQLCLALSYIHDKKILHRDLKTQNIFIQNKDTIRIGDFGIAKIFNQTREMAGSIVGTPLYMSPEQYNGKNYGYKSDIWSLGCCVYEMCNLKHAFEGNTWNAVVVKVLKGQHNPVNNMYSRDLINLVEAMLNINSKSRPTVARILESKLIKPKVANYIMDFVGNYKKYDGDLEQVEILKEQAEKFGIFQTNINNVINISSNAINSGGNGIDNGYESKTKIKDNQDIKGIILFKIDIFPLKPNQFRRSHPRLQNQSKLRIICIVLCNTYKCSLLINSKEIYFFFYLYRHLNTILCNWCASNILIFKSPPKECKVLICLNMI